MNKWAEYELLKAQIQEGLSHTEYQERIRQILDKLEL